MGHMKFGVYFSHRKICKRKIKVSPRGKYNTLHDEFFFQLLSRHNLVMQNEKEIICFSLLHKSVTKEIFSWFIHFQALCPDLSFSLILPVLRLQCHSLTAELQSWLTTAAFLFLTDLIELLKRVLSSWKECIFKNKIHFLSWVPNGTLNHIFKDKKKVKNLQETHFLNINNALGFLLEHFSPDNLISPSISRQLHSLLLLYLQ